VRQSRCALSEKQFAESVPTEWLQHLAPAEVRVWQSLLLYHSTRRLFPAATL
jgi:hypothetical protein